MTDDKPKKNSPDQSLDLSNLADFQFGPAWARSGSEKTNTPRTFGRAGEDRGRNGGKDGFAPRGRRQDDRGGRFERRDGERPFNRDRRDGARGRSFDGKSGGRDRFSQNRQREELPEPTAGLRVELRPADALLLSWTTEINKHRRVVSLFEFAKVVMAARERYDLVFMKQDGGPELYHSLKGDGSCWETKQEAVSFIWKASWFADFYTSVEEAVEPPKGEFQGIAKCKLTGDLIGPVNWHGYQSALMALHKSKFSHMPLEQFRHKIEIEKGEEVVQSWLESVSRKTVWKPVRDHAEDLVLDSPRALEQDFAEHFFDQAFALTDKVFVNGQVAKSCMSPGLWAHVIKLADTTRKHPSMLIPNLCHGLARHRMPIFKWKGTHHTGPSRPRLIPDGTVLADRMTGIIGWVKSHPGGRVESMLNDLGGLPTSEQAGSATSEESAPESASIPVETEKNEVEQKRHDLVSDLLWLCEQGFVLVFADGTVNMQQQPAPSPEKSKKQEEKNKGKTEEESTVKSEAKDAPKPRAKKAKAPAKSTVAGEAKKKVAKKSPAKEVKSVKTVEPVAEEIPSEGITDAPVVASAETEG